MAALVIAAAGAALGAAVLPTFAIFGATITGAQVGWALGSLAGSLVGPRGRSQGPRLDDLRVTGTEYGQAIPWVRGAPRMAGQLWWASEKRETATENEAGKGGGSTYTTFSYDVDLLIGLCDNELESFSRVWSNGNLTYTARSAASAESLAASDQTDAWKRITFYSGSADQLPDPTYEAAVGSTLAPGYRGRSYIFIEGLQLGTSGQIPNLTFEVGRKMSLSGTSKNSLMGSLATTAGAYPNDEAFVLAVHADDAGDVYFYVGSAAAARVVKITSAGVVSVLGNIAYYRSDIRSKGETDELASVGYKTNDSTSYTFTLYQGTNAAQSDKIITTPSNTFSTSPVWALRNNVLYMCSERGGGFVLTTIYRWPNIGLYPVQTYTPPFWIQSLAAGTDYLYALQDSTTPGASDQIYVLNAATMTLASTIGSPYAPIAQGTGRVLVNEDNELFYVRGNGLGTNAWWKRVDGAWVLVSSDLGSADPGNNVGGFTSQTSINRNTLYVARFVAGTHSAVVYRCNATQDPSTETVQSVVEAICARAGMDATQYDASALATIARPVRALPVGQISPSRAVLEQLQTAYFFECVLSDKLYFYPRGRTAVDVIPYADLAAGLDGAASEPFSMTVGTDLESVSMVAVKYRNMNKDQQVGVETEDRTISSQASLSTIDLSLGLLPTEAKQVAMAVVSDARASLVTAELALPISYSHLEPSDTVEVVSEDGSTLYRVRLVKRTEEQGVLRFESVVDDADVIEQTGQTDVTDFSATAVLPLADTEYLALDMPILRDDDNAAGYYVAARGSSARWAGGVILSGADNVTFSTAAAVNESAILGTCATTLGDWTGGVVFDEINSVTVNMAHGTLSSVTRDALLAGTDNTLLIGSEVIRFVDATLQSANPNIYKCTRLLRGVRGTEWAMTGHASSERAVLLRATGMRRVSQQTTESGQLRYLKGVSVGKDAAGVTAQTFTNTNVGLKPFAPVDLRGTRTTGGDMVLSWIRRTRLATRIVGGAGMSAPLGEALEAYEVEIWDAGYTARYRTISGLSQPVATYSADSQTADFGSIQSTIYVRVYQISASAGRGYALQASVANTLPSYFAALASNGLPSVTAGVGPVAIVQRIGASGGGQALGLYTLAIGSTPALSAFFAASSATPYLSGKSMNIAVDRTGERVVMYLNAISSPQALRRIVAGPPQDLEQVASGSPGFMPADPPACIAWTGSKFVLITVSGLVYHSTDTAIWDYQGPMSSGSPLFDPSPASTNVGAMRMVGGRLVMRYGTDVYYNDAADGITWIAATGDIAAPPLATYVNGFQLYAMEASDAGDAGIIIGYGRDAANTLGGVVYYTSDGATWTLLFSGEIGGPTWGARSTSFNVGLIFYNGEFLSDLWPLSPGSGSEDVLNITTAGVYPVKFNRRAASGVATTGGIAAIGNGTIGFLSETLYTSVDGVSWTSVDWSA